MDVVAVKRFDICLVGLDPTLGSELQKTRPCLIISPDSMNASKLKTIIIAPMTSTIRHSFPTRVDIVFQNKKGQIALDQLRVIDRARIIKILGVIHQQQVKQNVLQILQDMFMDDTAATLD